MSIFLSKDQEIAVMAAIKEAETNTSGEIRVHIEPKCKEENPIDRTKEVFTHLNMHETELKNGTLIYISTKDKKIAIWGDEGINAKVGQDFWEAELALMAKYFKANDYESGLREAILHIGNKLKEFFPYQKDDINELSDDISYGDESDA